MKSTEPLTDENQGVSQSNNDRLLRALLRQPVDRTPVWVMRQAGRYLPEYRATRKQAGDFLTLCKTPELACKVTLQPVERFELDAAILFSDILTIPDAMGLGLTINEGEGPRFARPVRSRRDIDALKIPDPEGELRYVMDAVRLIRAELGGRVPLIGFAGSPWTLASYMVEGQGSREFTITKTMLYNDSGTMERLLEIVTASVIDYLNAQITAGVQVVMLFDTWGGLLSTRAYDRFSLTPMRRIIDSLIRNIDDTRIPIVLFTKGGGQWLEQIADSGCDAIGLDWTVDIGAARRRVGDRVALQGNLDPAVLHASPDRIRDEVKAVLDGFGHGTGHVFNLGHGIQPSVNPEHLGALVQAVRELSVSYHE